MKQPYGGLPFSLLKHSLWKTNYCRRQTIIDDLPFSHKNGRVNSCTSVLHVEILSFIDQKMAVASFMGDVGSVLFYFSEMKLHIFYKLESFRNYLCKFKIILILLSNIRF